MKIVFSCLVCIVVAIVFLKKWVFSKEQLPISREQVAVWDNTVAVSGDSTPFLFAVKQQRLELYEHLDVFLETYPSVICDEDPSSCIEQLQNTLFSVSGYNQSNGVEWFVASWKQLYTQVDSTILRPEQRANIAHFDVLIAQMLRMSRQPLHIHLIYTNEVKGLIRGLQLQIKYQLLLLDPAWTDLPRAGENGVIWL